MKKLPQQIKGFTIIELLVSVTIIAILSTIGMNGYQSVARGGRDALRKSDLEQIRSALEIYKSQNNTYPNASVACVPDLTTDYINPYPLDPKSPTYKYCYVLGSGNLTYQLCARLENGSTSTDLCGGGNKCTGNCNYQVNNP